MRWILFVGAAMAVVVVVVVVIGAMLPKGHSASRTARIALPPDALHALILRKIAEPQEYPLRIERDEPPSLIVTRIVGEKLPFGGTWTYRIAPAPDGSDLTIVEDGEVYNPVFRFMSRFVIGHHATIDAFLKALESRAS
jgi:hypothetical protein